MSAGDKALDRSRAVRSVLGGLLVVADAHAIADAVEERLKKDLELEEVTVHVEPC